LSRTQHFRFKKISDSDIVNHLAHIQNLEKVEFEPEALQILARSGSGSLRDTLTLLDQAIIYSKGFVDVQTVTDMLGLVDPKVIEKIYENILSRDKKAIKESVEALQDYEAEMVIDQMIIFLKERLFEEDIRFTPIIYERFFRILSDAKSLLSINADEDFVLTLTLLKMSESLKIKEIEELIESFQNEDDLPPALSDTKDEPKNRYISPPRPQSPKQISPQALFEKLKEKLYDRNYELGKCFEESIKFISFENSVLTWESDAKGECRKKLKISYGIIRHFVQEIFGIDTKISKKDPVKKKTEEQKIEANAQCSSMIEEIEGGGSCVSAQAGLAAKEIDSRDILQEPMIQKAKELFDAKKIVVKSKV